MKIESPLFGSIEIDDQRIMRFVSPMAGFEGVVHYALLDPNPQSPFKVLQMTEGPERCLLAVDPAPFFPDYQVRLSAEQVADLELADPAQAVVLTLVTVNEAPGGVTANLRAPIVVNAEKLLAKQVLLPGTAHSVAAPLPVTARSG